MIEASCREKVCIEQGDQILIEEKKLEEQGTSSEIINSKRLQFDELMKQADVHKDAADSFASTLDKINGYKDQSYVFVNQLNVESF